jgi:hypothetical protein
MRRRLLELGCALNAHALIRWPADRDTIECRCGSHGITGAEYVHRYQRRAVTHDAS